MHLSIVRVYLKSQTTLQEMGTMPEVNLQTAVTVLTDLPEIGKADFSQLIALVGTCSL